MVTHRGTGHRNLALLTDLRELTATMAAAAPAESVVTALALTGMTLLMDQVPPWLPSIVCAVPVGALKLELIISHQLSSTDG